MKAFVTGAAGFLGASLVRRLIERGDTVTAAVRDPACANRLAGLGCDLLAADLAASSEAELQAAMSGADAVFHLAGSLDAGLRTFLPA